MRRLPPPLLLGLANAALVLALGGALAGPAALAAHPLAALAAALLAAGAGTTLGRRLAAPARRLAGAAARLGAGDLRVPLPAGGDAETARLGSTLEEMRRRLLALTSELERRETEARAVLAGVVEGVLAVDGERRVTYLNPQAERLLGVDTAAARGRFCGDLLRPESSDGSYPCDDRCPLVHARSRGTSRAVEALRLPAGRRQVVLTTSAPSGPDANGSQVMVLRDETEEEAGRRVRDVVLANLSHELKTPLAAQLASVELLRDGLAAAAAAPGAVALVGSLERSTLRLLGLVENLLASARLETGEWTMRSDPVDLAEVAGEAAGLLAPLFEQRRQRVEAPAAGAAWVLGDRTQLLQVLLNLLGNANKFAPEGTRVRIAGERRGDQTLLAVEDEGPGLPPGDQASLFGRYRRFGGAARPHGAGLGLWIVQSIVRRHGGSVAAETRAEGGARFTVRLPAAEVPAA